MIGILGICALYYYLNKANRKRVTFSKNILNLADERYLGEIINYDLYADMVYYKSDSLPYFDVIVLSLKQLWEKSHKDDQQYTIQIDKIIGKLDDGGILYVVEMEGNYDIILNHIREKLSHINSQPGVMVFQK